LDLWVSLLVREEDADDDAAVPAEEAEIAFWNEGSHILASHENRSSDHEPKYALESGDCIT